MEKKILAIVGIGNMGNALLSAVIKNHIFDEKNIFVYDTNTEKTDFVLKLYPKIKIASSELEILDKSDIIIMAVKPDKISEITSSYSKGNYKDKLFISIAAGVKIKSIEKNFIEDIKLIRVMPNTPLIIGKGVSALSFNKNVNDIDKLIAKRIFNSCGSVFVLEEDKLDTITGLSGSGPAYVYIFIKALAEGGIKNGLPSDIALKIAAETVYGSAAMILETGEHPEILKDRVMSPGGTTISGIMSLEKAGFRHAVMDAVTRAVNKSKKIGKKA